MRDSAIAFPVTSVVMATAQDGLQHHRKEHVRNNSRSLFSKLRYSFPCRQVSGKAALIFDHEKKNDTEESFRSYESN